MYNRSSIVIGMSTVTVWDVGCRFLSSGASLGPASPQATPSMSLAGATKLGKNMWKYEKNGISLGNTMGYPLRMGLKSGI